MTMIARMYFVAFIHIFAFALGNVTPSETESTSENLVTYTENDKTFDFNTTFPDNETEETPTIPEENSTIDNRFLIKIGCKRGYQEYHGDCRKIEQPAAIQHGGQLRLQYPVFSVCVLISLLVTLISP